MSLPMLIAVVLAGIAYGLGRKVAHQRRIRQSDARAHRRYLKSLNNRDKVD